MKHQIRKFQLGRTTKHRQALWYNLFRSLILHGKINTTHAKAKSLISIAEKYITMAKEYDLSKYRRVLAFLRNDEITAGKVFELAKVFKDQPGGYFKIIKIGQRQGDSAHTSCIMFKEIS